MATTANATAHTPNSEARAAISRALIRLIIVQPWYASLAYRLVVKEDSTVPTAATDGVSLLYNPKWFAGLDRRYQEGVLAHEVSHCSHLHMTRRGGRNPSLWNQAGDHIINLELLEAGFKLPPDCLADKRFAGMSTEQAYAILSHEQEQNGGGGGTGTVYIDPLGGVQDAPSSGSQPTDTPGTTPAPGATGGTPTPTPTPSELESDWRVAVTQASMVSAKAGKLPAGASRTIKETQSQNDWYAVLQRYLVTPGDYSWTRPNRRFVSRGLYLPGQVPDRPGTVVIAVDTSGSISEALLSAFAAESEAILNSAGWPQHVYVVYCDSYVHSHEELSHGLVEFHPQGGGGTLAQPVFDYVQEQGWEPNVLFYLTDLDLGDEPTEPSYPVVWVAPDHAYSKAPFGETAYVPLAR